MDPEIFCEALSWVEVEIVSHTGTSSGSLSSNSGTSRKQHLLKINHTVESNN